MIFKKNKNNHRTLYLHVGCGKTGSSALQIWLAKNQKAFRNAGYHYPISTKSSKHLGDYSITSGNGVQALAALRDGNWESLITSAFSRHSKAIFSSEFFQAATKKEITEIRATCSSMGVDVKIIAYVRNVYDVAYASYIQGIKRQNFRKSFKEHVQQNSKLQQFLAIERLESVFDDITLLHYDSEKNNGLDRAFCKAIGMEDTTIPVMRKSKVNRSLTVRESQLVQAVNQHYYDKFQDSKGKFGFHITNRLLEINPDQETEVFYDPSIERHLSEKYQSVIDHINKRYFKAPSLCVFNAQEKVLVTEIPEVEADLNYFIDALVDAHHRLSASGNDTSSNVVAITNKQQPLPELLRNEAIKLETLDLKAAYSLMQSAAALRPNGPVINAKIMEYEAKLNLTGGNTGNKIHSEKLTPSA